MIERTEERFDLKSEWLAADTAYGSRANLNWLVKDKKNRQGPQRVHLPGWKDPHDDRQVGQRWRDPSLHGQHASLPQLPVESSMLPKGAFPQHLRGDAARRLPRPRHSNNRVMTENALRCCLHISSVSCGLVACDYAGRAGPSSSSRWQRSRGTSAGWPS